jgi:hypothetical protein
MGKIVLAVDLQGIWNWFVLRNHENYLLNIGFPAVKIRKCIAFKIVKAHG